MERFSTEEQGGGIFLLGMRILGIATGGAIYLYLCLMPGVSEERITIPLPLTNRTPLLPIRYDELCFSDPLRKASYEERFFAGFPVPLTGATLAMLASLPGFGPTLAKRLYERIQTHPPLQDPEELLKIPGIGRKRLELLKERFLLEGETPSSEPGIAPLCWRSSPSRNP
jgi:hypothetical protein